MNKTQILQTNSPSGSKIKEKNKFVMKDQIRIIKTSIRDIVLLCYHKTKPKIPCIFIQSNIELLYWLIFLQTMNTNKFQSTTFITKSTLINKSLTLNYEKKPINLTRINKFTHTITKSDKKKMMIITAIWRLPEATEEHEKSTRWYFAVPLG